MTYTIATRARRNGFYFERHELEPVGIADGSKCWGLWIEGRNFDEASRLDDPTSGIGNETPHLVVSAIHPACWPTAFNLQVLLQRRPFEGNHPPESCDAFLGLWDALLRCGVNIISIQTSQVGYDLISVLATCEFPRLRRAAARLVDLADRAGQQMELIRAGLEPEATEGDREAARTAAKAMFEAARDKEPLARIHACIKPGVSEEDRTSALRVADERMFQLRAAAFQSLGLLVTPRLAELEARLIAMDSDRRLYWKALRNEHDSGLDRGTLEACAADDARFAVIVGHAPPRGDDPVTKAERAKQYMDAISAPWFLNSKIAAAGENSYFLAYHSVRDREAMDKARPAGISLDDLIQGDHELSQSESRFLYTHVYQTLKNTPLSASMRRVVPPSPATRKTRGLDEGQSATAERIAGVDSDQEFECLWYHDFFRRQALVPVRVSALPSLAYARFWAFGGAQGRGKPIELRYRDNLLLPDLNASHPSGRLANIFEFLTKTTGTTGDATFGPFGPQMAVLANMNLADRFMRMRFARERLEPAAYVTVRVPYVVKAMDDFGPKSQGLVRSLSLVLVRKGLCIQRASITVLEADFGIEKCTIEIIARAASRAGLEACKTVASAKAEVARLWVNELIELAGRPPGWDVSHGEPFVGFAPVDR